MGSIITMESLRKYIHTALKTGRIGIIFLLVGGISLPGERILASSLDSAVGAQAFRSGMPDALGAQKIAVFLVNFTDNQSRPMSRDHVYSKIFREASDFFKEMSYGQTWLEGDVFDWMTLPIRSTCDAGMIGSETKKLAIAAGIDLTAYQHLIYINPKQGCVWGGFGTVGGTPSEMWINGDLTLKVFSHEFGHNLGLWHADARDYGAVPYDPNIRFRKIPAGDRYDAMGSWNAFHFNASMKETLGWLDVDPITQSGTYEIFSMATQGDTPKAFKIAVERDYDVITYYLEYRGAHGHDGLANENLRNGVLIHLGGNPSVALDMTPETESWYDPALVVGKTFVDPIQGIIIEPVQTTENSILVNVRFEPSSMSPLVNAGEDQTETLPATIHLSGHVMPRNPVPTAESVAVEWRLARGPGSVIFDDPASLQTRARFSKPGVYTLRLYVDDGRFFSFDEVTLNLLPEPAANAIGTFKNYFNPARQEEIQVTYKLDQDGPFSLEVFDRRGRKINTLINESRSPGVYTTAWNGRNTSGEDLSSGIYLLFLRAAGKIHTKKVAIIK